MTEANTMPVLRLSQPNNTVITHRERQAHHQELTAYFEKGNPLTSQNHSAFTAAGRTTAGVLQATAAQTGQPIRPGSVVSTPRAAPNTLEALIQERRETPEAMQTTAYKANWEARYAAIIGGKAPPAAVKPQIVPAGTTAVNAAIDTALKLTDKAGMIDSHRVPAALLAGYTLPTNKRVHLETATHMLAQAKIDGTPQSVVTAYVNAL